LQFDERGKLWYTIKVNEWWCSSSPRQLHHLVL
jgi:hypothetical protein